MSQYSLTTCDPLAPRKEDRRDVRKAQRLPSAGPITVLFEAGTMSTRAGSANSVSCSAICEDLEPDSSSSSSSSGSSPASSDDGSYPATLTKFAYEQEPSGMRSVLGGEVVESPTSSRRGTVDAQASSDSDAEELEAALLPTLPTIAMIPVSLAHAQAQATTVQELPQSEKTALRSCEDELVFGSHMPRTPPTPLVPAPLSRVFGHLVKALKRS
ncbi:hypothetical protein C8Q80DRAFT_610578 [Daedaleopsis nitida]|nr:hypothetical protein C8Q80DRAFT_610578 [Daedaleopsis nitida]